VGAPFLAVAEGRKVYWEITVLEAQGTVRVGFAGTKMTFGNKKRNEHIGQGQKSWSLSSDNGNGYHWYDFTVSMFTIALSSMTPNLITPLQRQNRHRGRFKRIFARRCHSGHGMG
jgi:hypothetical protein